MIRLIIPYCVFNPLTPGAEHCVIMGMTTDGECMYNRECDWYIFHFNPEDQGLISRTVHRMFPRATYGSIIITDADGTVISTLPEI